MLASNALKTIKQSLRQNRHRNLCVLQGRFDWQVPLLLAVEGCSTIEQLMSEDIIVYSTKSEVAGNVDRNTFRQHLGKEYSTIVFVGDDIHPDMFAALAGTLKAGGFFYWLISDSFAKDHYAERFYQFFANHHGAVFVSEKNAARYTKEDRRFALSADLTFPYGAKSHEQAEAVEAIIHVSKGHRNRPFVLTADRGRGKSAALALAVAELFKGVDKQHDIVITAGNKLSIQGVFTLLNKKLPGSDWQNNHLRYKQHRIQFLPVDEIIRTKPDTTLMLIDEAAGIPLYLLSDIVASYSRLVFSSTLHGYEGAGRGFALKFDEILRQQKQQACWDTLTKPIRWQEHDPLESFVFDACLLNAELPVINDLVFSSSQLHFETLDKATLSRDESLLRQIFSLLVTAHYQTSADDLQLLLNNDNVRVFTLSKQGNYLAVALIIEEGSVSKEEKEGILAGKRRLKDQFVPQLLAAHAGIREAFDFSYWRIMRIAVHPSCQSKGLGSKLLVHIKSEALASSCDILATSFGINKKLLKFWHQNDFVTTRVGISKDKSSGEHSGLLLQPNSASSEAMVNQAQQDFLSNFSYLLLEEFNDFSPQLVQEILLSVTTEPISFIEPDKTNLTDFAFGNRQFDYCAHSIGKFVLSSVVVFKNTLSEEMIALCLMRWSKKRVIAQYGLVGKKALNEHLVDQAKLLMTTHFQ